MPIESRAPISEKMQLTGLANLGNNLDYASDALEDQIRGRKIAVIAHAGGDMDVAATKARIALEYHGVGELVNLHEKPSNEARFIFQQVDGVYIAGGNTFALVVNVAALRNTDGRLIDTRPTANTEAFDGFLKEMAEEGLVIAGASAGLMIMGRDIRTCSDDPRDFVNDNGVAALTGFDLLPFSFHPHFEPDNPEMAQELSTHTEIDPNVRIFAIQNESFITVRNGQMDLHGQGGTLFDAQGTQSFGNNTNLTHIL